MSDTPNLAATLQALRKMDIDAVVAERVANVVYNYEHSDGRPGEAMAAIQRAFQPYRAEYGLTP